MTETDMRMIQKFSKLMESIGGLVPQLGMEYGFEDGTLKCRMQLDQRHQGAPGVAHGGALMALLDSALGGHALMHAYPLHRATSTVEMKVNFLRPARLGTTIVTSTTIQSAGRSLLVISGSAREEDTGKQVAFAVGTFNLYEDDKATAFYQADV